MEQKLHWWYMVFHGENANVYSRVVGFDTAGLTRGKIVDAYELYFPATNVLMTNAIYLGYMTEEENNAREDLEDE